MTPMGGEKIGLTSYTGDGHNDDWRWVGDKLREMSISELYKKHHYKYL